MVTPVQAIQGTAELVGTLDIQDTAELVGTLDIQDTAEFPDIQDTAELVGTRVIQELVAIQDTAEFQDIQDQDIQDTVEVGTRAIQEVEVLDIVASQDTQVEVEVPVDILVDLVTLATVGWELQILLIQLHYPIKLLLIPQNFIGLNKMRLFL